MKALIQHNFKSGLGDLYTDMSEYMTMAEELKKHGYEIHLVLCLYYNKYVTDKFLDKILSEETLNFFDSITETFNCIGSFEYEDYKYGFSAHAPQIPAQHRWDVFFDEYPNFEFPNFRLSCNSLMVENQKFISPTFNNIIEDNAKKFADSIGGDYSFFHIRAYDDGENDEGVELICKNVENKMSDVGGIFHVGSNNKKVVERLKKNKNVITYDFETTDIIDNDMNSVVWSQINDNDLLVNRVIDILSEMVSLKYCEKIFYSGYYNWSSSFLFYGASINKFKEDKFIRINYK